MHAGIPGVPTGGGGGGVWSSLGLVERSGGPDGVGECFYRSRRATTLEPQDTLAAVSGEAGRVNLVAVRGR